MLLPSAAAAALRCCSQLLLRMVYRYVRTQAEELTHYTGIPYEWHS